MKQVLSIILAILCLLGVTLSAGAVSASAKADTAIAVTGVDPDEYELPLIGADVDPTAPDTPAEHSSLSAPVLSSVSVTAAGVVFRWNKVSGAVKYRAFRREGKSAWKRIGDTAGLTVTDKKAVSGHTYTYTVRCITANGKNASIYDTVGKTIRFIAAPAVKTLRNGKGGVSITWTKSSGAVKYMLLKKTDNGGWKRVGKTAGLKYFDKKVISGCRYTYTVRCVTASGTAYTSGYRTGRAIRYIAAPRVSSVTNSGLKITVRWKRSAGAEVYRVYCKKPNGNWKKLGDTKSTALTYTHAAKTSTEYYTVRCLNKAKTAYTSAMYTPGYRFTLTVKNASSSGGTTANVNISAQSNTASSGAGKYVGSAKSDVFHYPDCASAKRISSVNLVRFSSAADAKSKGYRPCAKCNPR